MTIHRFGHIIMPRMWKHPLIGVHHCANPSVKAKRKSQRLARRITRRCS